GIRAHTSIRSPGSRERTEGRTSAGRRRLPGNGSISVLRPLEIRQHSLADERSHLGDAVADGPGQTEGQALLHLFERDAVIAGVLFLLYELDRGVRRVSTDELNQIQLAIVLSGGAHVED